MDSSVLPEAIDIGDRVVPTEKYFENFPTQQHAKVGHVVGFCRWPVCVTVQWDGHETRMSLHKDYIRKDER